jgi:hypothetical protein
MAPTVAARLDEGDLPTRVKYADDVADAVGNVVDVDGIDDRPNATATRGRSRGGRGLSGRWRCRGRRCRRR